MDIATASIIIVFLGLLTLIVGYTKRDARFGPFVIWVGVMMMLSVIVYYIFRTLR